MQIPSTSSLPRLLIASLVALLNASQYGVAAANSPAPSPSVKSQQQALTSYGKLPLSFEANQGQTDRQVRFLSRGQGYSLFLTNSAAILSLSHPARSNEACHPERSEGSASSLAGPRVQCPAEANPDTVRMSLSGSNPKAQVTGESKLPGKVNYFLGNDPTKWHSDLPTYAKVRYSQVYPGIDLVYYGNQSQLEYDFVVAPGASPTLIRLTFTGQKHLTLAPNGDLILQGADGQATLHKPVIYQQNGSHHQPIPGSFRLLANNTVTFQLGSYDHSKSLIIDPVLVYSTYLGGSGAYFYNQSWGDQGNGIAVDSTGNAYVVGQTYSVDFPVTSGAYQSKNKGAIAGYSATAFVSKFNAAGTALIFSTFLGGSGGLSSLGHQGDFGKGIALDAENNVYLTGNTNSTDFPLTSGAIQTSNQNSYNNGAFYELTGFVTKLNAQGNALVYSTYLGGASVDGPGFATSNAIAVDASGNAYVTGGTSSPTFPVTPGSFQTTLPSGSYSVTSYAVDAYVAKLNPTGTALVYSTYLGGSGNNVYTRDQGNAIAIDSSGDAYVAGFAGSADFPVTAGAFQTVNHGVANQVTNAFVTELNPSGTAEVYSTFLGGSGSDSANSVAIDSGGNVYVAGSTASTDFPLLGGVWQSLTYSTAGFVSKFNPTLSALAYSTYLGGDYCSVNALAVDADGKAYVTGPTNGVNFISSPDAFPPENPGATFTIFVAKFNASGDALEYSSLVSVDTFRSTLALDMAGNTYVTGTTYALGFPTTSGAFQPTNHGLYNAFVSKFGLANETNDYFPVMLPISASVSSLNQGQPVTVSVQALTPPGSPTPTGQVTILGLAKPNPMLTLDQTGLATWTSSSLAPGLYKIYATYPGDVNHLYSLLANAKTQFRVVGPPTAIVDSGNPYQNRFFGYGDYRPRPISALVTDSSGYGLQGVTVHFSGSSLTFASTSAVTDANGFATVNFVAHQAGTLSVIASVTSIAVPLSIPIQVSPAPLSITVTPNSRPYGANNPVFKNLVSGLIGSDSLTVTDTTSATLASPVAYYPINITISGSKAIDYVVGTVIGSLHVRPAQLTLQAASHTSVYGTTPPQPTTYTLTGFVNGETIGIVTGSPVLSTTVTAATPVGYYPIQTSIGSLAAPNYTIAPFTQKGVIHVTKAPLTLTANNITIHHGDPLPPLTYTLTGFVNGNTQANSTTGAPVLKTQAGSQTRPGAYPILIGKGSLYSPNYSFIPTNGTLTILP